MAEEPAAPLLELDDVHLSFGRTQVLRGLKFAVRKGETVAVIGEVPSFRESVATRSADPTLVEWKVMAPINVSRLLVVALAFRVTTM